MTDTKQDRVEFELGEDPDHGETGKLSALVSTVRNSHRRAFNGEGLKDNAKIATKILFLEALRSEAFGG